MADPEGTLVFALGGEVSILNPILSSDSASSAVEGAIFSGLTKVNQKLEIVPDLAKRWEVSADGLKYTFYLRDDVFWHDGEKFTAEDAKFTFDSILDPKVNSVRRGDYIIEGRPIKFLAKSPYVFEAVLPKPFAPFLSGIGMGLLPKHLLQGGDVNLSHFNQHPVGTGPFVFVKWSAGDRIVLKRNEKFYAGVPKLEKIIYRIIPDDNSRLLAFEAGEIDECDVPAKDYGRALAMKNVNIFEYDSLSYVYLGFNMQNRLFSDIRVRQALAYATDKKQLIALIFRGLATPAYSPSSPVSWSYEKNVEKFELDRKKAGALLSKAGWIIGSDGFRYKDGKKLEFTCLVNQGNKEREKAAVILEWQMKKIGVKINIRMMEWSALLKIVNSGKQNKDFDAVIIGWSLGIDPDSYSIWHSSQFPGGLNFIGYNNTAVDRALEKGRSTIQKSERKKVYSTVQRLIAHDQPYVFLWYPRAVIAVSSKVGGLSEPGPAGVFVDLEKVFVVK